MRGLLSLVALCALPGCMLNLGVGQTVAEQTQVVPLEKAKDAIDKAIESAAVQQLHSDMCLSMQLKDDGGNHGVIRPRVENRVVILEGTVETEAQKRRATELVGRIEKVREVLNELEVIGRADATTVCEDIGFGYEDEEPASEPEGDSGIPLPPIPITGGGS